MAPRAGLRTSGKPTVFPLLTEAVHLAAASGSQGLTTLCALASHLPPRENRMFSRPLSGSNPTRGGVATENAHKGRLCFAKLTVWKEIGTIVNFPVEGNIYNPCR